MRTPGPRRGAVRRILRSERIQLSGRIRRTTSRQRRSTWRSKASSTPTGCSGTSTRRRPAACAEKARSRPVAVGTPGRERPDGAGGVVWAQPDRLRAAQPAFAATGGLHATGLFAADGAAIVVREDVGRHNAFDKVVGRAFLDGLLPLFDYLVCVSGRLSFELVQKAAVAGAPVVAAVGAPSTLAVQLAPGPRDYALRLRPGRPPQRLLGALEGHVSFGVPAAAYDRFVGRYGYCLCEALAPPAGITGQSSVLDVGAGTGIGTHSLVDLVGSERVAAVEPSEPFVERCASASRRPRSRNGCGNPCRSRTTLRRGLGPARRQLHARSRGRGGRDAAGPRPGGVVAAAASGTTPAR